MYYMYMYVLCIILICIYCTCIIIHVLATTILMCIAHCRPHNVGQNNTCTKMRRKKERSKQGQTNKQGKATQYTHVHACA